MYTFLPFAGRNPLEEFAARRAPCILCLLAVRERGFPLARLYQFCFLLSDDARPTAYISDEELVLFVKRSRAS